ncbi:hypothetical protein M0R72_18345 [Candidatus Pacearchaeota archaeon]|jgi:hypothetical protein|nr:hypothetical protein [Candidatus Pacearchaeota archaeon]
MRDLEADKKIWEDAWLNQGYSDCAYIANTILPHAIERAINAEGEVERLKLMVKSITGGLDETIETNHYLENELVKYNLAFKLACKSLDETQKNYFTPGGWSLETTFLKQAQIELEQQEGEKNEKSKP